MRSRDRLTAFEVAVLQALLSGRLGGAAAEATSHNYSKSTASSATYYMRQRFGAATTYMLFIILRERGFITSDMQVRQEPVTLGL